MAPPKTRSKSHIFTVEQAAKLLGISEPTLRPWDEAGRFKACRHPIGGYRLYDRRKVLAMRKEILGTAT